MIQYSRNLMSSCIVSYRIVSERVALVIRAKSVQYWSALFDIRAPYIKF